MNHPDDSPSETGAPAERFGDEMQLAGVITAEQKSEITRYAQAHGLRFSQAAIRLGIVDRSTLENPPGNKYGLAPLMSAELDKRLFAFNEPNSPSAEDFRSLRNTLGLRWFNHPEGMRTLAVISPTRKDGRSAVAANLAISFAQVGFRTILIDADLRYPSQQTLFNLQNNVGLVSFLAGHDQNAALYDIPSVPGLTVLPVGGMPPNPQELLIRGRLGELLRDLGRRFDVVILDTPAAEAGSDYKLICAEAIGAFVVARQDRTQIKELRQLVAECRELGGRIVGSTMTCPI